MFVHSADKLAEMRAKFHIIQAKLIMSVWCFTVHCRLHGYSGRQHKADDILSCNSQPSLKLILI